MLLLKTLLFACATVSLAAPTWSSDNFDIEVRGLEDFDVRDLDMFDALEARGFDGVILEARTDPKFAQLGPGDKRKAKDFVTGAGSRRVADAAGGGDSARTVHADGQFHLDRQQPGSDRHASKVAVQLNKPLKNKGPTTVGQVAVHHGTRPDPKTVAARLKHSINTGTEQRLPQRSKQDRKAANVAANDAKRQAKAGRVAQKQAQGRANAKAGNYKKGKKG